MTKFELQSASDDDRHPKVTLLIVGDEHLEPFRDPLDFRWINPPNVIHYIQRALKVRAEDHGKFAVSVRFAGDHVDRFMTPKTEVDRMYWTNGLDGCVFVHESIALFENPQLAAKAIQRGNWAGCCLFKLCLEESVARLEFVGHQIRPGAEE